MSSALDSLDLSPDEVRRRFRWAKRQGHPAWLWPEVTSDAWRDALRNIERVVAAALSVGTDIPLLEGEAAAIGLAGYTSGVGPLLGTWLEAGRIRAAPGLAPVLELHLRHNRIRAARMEAAAVDVVKALLQRGLAVAVLKGAHTARAYFPEPGARPASDIDLLVAAGQAGEAEAVLEARGYACASRKRRESAWRPPSSPAEPRSLMLAHAEDPWSIDLHSSLALFVGAGAPLADLDAAEPLKSRTPWRPCPDAVAPDQPLLLLHLAAHAGAGLQNLTLLRLVELVLVIRQDTASGALAWPEFLEVGERTGALGYAYPALRLSEALAPGVVPAFALERCARLAPASVVRLVATMTPATAQRIDRSSVAEHFMWTRGWGGRLRQIASDVLPAAAWEEVVAIYERRAWRLLRGRFSR